MTRKYIAKISPPPPKKKRNSNIYKEKKIVPRNLSFKTIKPVPSGLKIKLNLDTRVYNLTKPQLTFNSFLCCISHTILSFFFHNNNILAGALATGIMNLLVNP